MNNIKVFENILDESFDKLSYLKKEITLNRKGLLFSEYQVLNNVYFIKEGKVSIYKITENGERKIIFILKKGDMINEIIIDKNVRSVFACEGFEKSILYEFNSNDLLEIMEKDFSLTKNIISHNQYINKRLYRQLKNTISIRIDKKLAAKLYKIGIEFGINNGEWTLVSPNITITYLADMLGCKRETVSRAMKILQEKDIVKIDNRKIYLKMNELSIYFKIN
ncbi:MAG: Crp/Fnr family transcriptional regulator [Peptostreptococcaceae bacterium]